MQIVKRLITRTMRGQLSKLDDLHQRHAGEECYIFGDGVSLKWMDLHQFADRTAIFGNMMVYHKEASALKVPYCTLTEPYWFWPVFPYGRGRNLRLLRHRIHKQYRQAIRSNPKTLFFVNISNYPVARFSNALYVTRWYKPPFEAKNPFAERPDSQNGTLKFQISLAIYLGFKRAFLVGHDYTHLPSRSLHFYEKGEGIQSGSQHKDFSREFLNYAKQHMDLVTVTLDGVSDTLRYVTYKDLTGKDPQFRENTDLINRVDLESLATWHGYSIF
jgi:hypothetical protein